MAYLKTGKTDACLEARTTFTRKDLAVNREPRHLPPSARELALQLQ